ncbi:MAG TPA: hypothetical protein PLL80_00300 [Candidatus Pacearchaeota archaeon]|nr:hypothetical protein [Candidatus Pacearchaeota archaeon]HOK93971.1 hypothetical protein [Candidatus Pacearchaeota archaeon]HPO75042.1 hypothetical protein [Candidatus Pacearchaeota archaeon]
MEKKIGLISGIIIGIVLWIVAIFFLLLISNVAAIIGGIGLAIVIGILEIYLILAPNNFIFARVDEGTARVVVGAGAFKKALIQWKGYTFDENWNVVKEDENHKEPWHPLGGIRFYGIPPFRQIYCYNFKWTHLHQDGIVKSHDEWICHVLLKRDLYVVQIPLSTEKQAEDINGMPLGISMVFPIRVVNVYEVIFYYKRWLLMITGTVEALMREFVARYRYKEDLLDMRAGTGIEKIQIKNGIVKDKSMWKNKNKPEAEAKAGEDLKEKFWQELAEKLSEKAKEEGGEVRLAEEGNIRAFGAEIIKQGFGVISIEPSEEYRRLTTLTYETEQKKKARILEGEAEREAISQETSKALIKMLSDLSGRTEEEAQKWLNEQMEINTEVKKLILEANLEWIDQEMAKRSGGKGITYIKTAGTGLTGLEALIALAKKFINEEK